MPDAATILSDRYELGPELGHGGMARVLRGTDRQLGRHVAIKVLSPPYDRDQAFVERFRREAHAAARLNHPSIVAVYDTGSDDGTHYIVTELVEGETLADLLEREGPLPPRRAVDVATEVTRALEAAHERGVVHRDVKPGNVMLTPEGRVKVVDFGIARAAGVESLTRSGLVLGSAPYLSPEQARGEPGDERSDIYALGCVLYEMLTGHPPFKADTPVATLYLHVHEQVPSPSSVRDVPADLEAIVLRCLEKDPAARFQAASELEQALADVGDPNATMPLPAQDFEPTAPVERIRPPTGSHRPPEGSHRPPRDRRIWWLVGGLAALVLLITWAAFALSDGRSLREEARDQSRDSRSPSPSVTPEGPLTVGDAYVTLTGAIDAAQFDGGIDEGTANDLRERAEDIMVAYEENDTEEITKKIEEFDENLAKAREEEKITVEAADTIDVAFADFVSALGAALPTPEETVDEGGENGGHGGEGGGPPPHSNSGGDGNGND
jgi:eukaryotic-like serine/threonine-protein kinase